MSADKTLKPYSMGRPYLMHPEEAQGAQVCVIDSTGLVVALTGQYGAPD